jgi:hypothetical protein
MENATTLHTQSGFKARLEKGTAMRWGIGARILEMEQQEAYERGMAHAARLRAQQAREKRSATTRGPAVGGGSRTISRQEAVALLMKQGHVRGALKLQNLSYGKPTGRR